jgi:D-amino-acid oxidase
MKRVAVIGGGITGITSAIFLREKGYSTTLYTHLRPDEVEDLSKHPEFATLYPAACIVPHTVEMPDLLEVFDTSQKIFAGLVGIAEAGVRWQTHFELSDERVVNLPSYTRVLRNCVAYQASEHKLRFDVALGEDVTGWAAEVLFAETPIYLRYLYQRFLHAGGVVMISRLEREDIFALREDIIVNCTALWSRSLFHDQNLYPTRGYLIFVDGITFPPLKDGRIFSYNYKPHNEKFEHDVYFFPRRGARGVAPCGWLLGGTREEADPIRGEPWQFPPLTCAMMQSSPEPIYIMNGRILQTLTGIDISKYPFTAYFGYRPSRKGGVRLELVLERNRPIIHNYGHGGAGVALSWGCAERVARMVHL